MKGSRTGGLSRIGSLQEGESIDSCPTNTNHEEHIQVPISKVDEQVPETVAFAAGKYELLPAGCIRVLHLEPAAVLNSPLKGGLVAVSTRGDASPIYDALSYAWEGAFNNEPLPDHDIQLAGTSVKIAGNLGHALRALRSTTETRTLWIDAICINQKDDAEKSVQVQGMSTVYSKAAQVMARLGEDSTDRDGEAVFHCMKQSLRGKPLAANSEEALAACQAAKKFYARR
ncbi:putative heterokaryon incompatibility [Septoria linicola]|nr:putative heterokaryon incompatibility [Septoria linicola]